MPRPLFDNPPPLFKSKTRLFSKAKSSGDPSVVWGWASVIEKDGKVVTDHDGDRISESELVRAAHKFVQESRVGGALHVYNPTTNRPLKAGDVCESMVFTKDLQRALGIDLKKVGWLVAIRLTDPDVRKAVGRQGLRALSIGGTAARVPVQEAD